MKPSSPQIYFDIFNAESEGGALKVSLVKPVDYLSFIYNIALNDRTSLNQLFHYLQESLQKHEILYTKSPSYQAFRAGDMRHSQADISKARFHLGYEPQFTIQLGIEKALLWYIEHV